MIRGHQTWSLSLRCREGHAQPAPGFCHFLWLLPPLEEVCEGVTLSGLLFVPVRLGVLFSSPATPPPAGDILELFPGVARNQLPVGDHSCGVDGYSG